MSFHRLSFGLILVFCLLPAGALPQNNPQSQNDVQIYDDAAGYDVLSLILEQASKEDHHKLIRIFQFTDSSMINGLDGVTIANEFQPAVGEHDHAEQRGSPQTGRERGLRIAVYEVLAVAGRQQFRHL